MVLTVKLLALLFGLILFGVFIKIGRNKSLKPFYLTLWLTVSLFVLSFVIFERFYQWFAAFLGIENATFLVIVGLISFLLLYVLYLSIKISELSNRVQGLISHSSILEHEIRKIKEKNLEHHDNNK
jgi:hypothetical protein